MAVSTGMNRDLILDHIIWNTLAGAHKRFSAGTDAARRYASGFSPIIAFPDPERPDFEALAPFCESGEHFYCDGWSGAAPAGWRIAAESTMFKMVWEGAAPEVDEAPHAVRLGPEHIGQAVALATLTNPGPFGPRTIELGEYWGYLDGGRLAAMAGERFRAAPYQEISGVCTHPDYQGRGYARGLMRKLIRREMERGETPFLHVMHDNKTARGLYARMGFREYRETVVRVIGRD